MIKIFTFMRFVQYRFELFIGLPELGYVYLNCIRVMFCSE